MPDARPVLSLDAIIPFKLSRIIGRPSIHTRKATARAFTALAEARMNLRSQRSSRFTVEKRGLQQTEGWKERGRFPLVERMLLLFAATKRFRLFPVCFSSFFPSFRRFAFSLRLVSLSPAFLLSLFLSFLFFFFSNGYFVYFFLSPLDVSVFCFSRLLHRGTSFWITYRGWWRQRYLFFPSLAPFWREGIRFWQKNARYY